MNTTAQPAEIPTGQLAYTPRSAAKATDTSPRYIFQEIKAGRLEARKPSKRKTLIPADSLRAWLAALPTRDVAVAA